MRKTYILVMFLLMVVSLSYVTLGQKLINESFFEMDLRQALNQLAYDTGKTIIADDLVGGYVTMELKDVTLERALDLLLLAGGFSWTKIDDVYYVSLATPDSDKFMYFSVTKEYRLKNYKSSDLVSLLPMYMRKYVNVAKGDPYALTISAPKEMAKNILSLIEQVDKPKKEINVEITVVEVGESTFKKWERDWGYSSTAGTSNAFSIAGDWFKVNVLNYLGNFSGNFKLNHTSENVKILSESTVHMLDGAQSKLFSKTTRIYQYTEGSNVRYQNVEIGVETDILPMFMGDKVVLNISQTLSSAQESGAKIPSSVKQGIQTSVIMDMNSRISVASIGFKTLASVESKIPLLGDIPLVGKLFTQLSYKNVRKRIVLFVALKGGDGR